MLTIPVAPVGETRSREKEFLELVYADEELLRAEFDAIVAEEWPTDGPPGRPRATSRGTGPSPARQPERPGVRASAGKAPHPLGRLPGRQRSPPPASRATALTPARTSRDTRRQVIIANAAPVTEATAEQPLAWAAFVTPRQTQPARRPRLDGVSVRDPGEARPSPPVHQHRALPPMAIERQFPEKEASAQP
jgi:hypothetical protein